MHNGWSVSLQGSSKVSDMSNHIPVLTMQYRIAIGSYSESQGSGVIFTIKCELVLFMISLMSPLIVGWPCSALPVHKWNKWTPTFHLNPNETQWTGGEGHSVIPLFTKEYYPHRLLYQPQLVVDGNIKLVHLAMKQPTDDVSLSNGELFMVGCPHYVDHLAYAPER
jgi:hypothetical protein